MDLKEIHALHAQYASRAHTIDVAGPMTGVPALPAPGARHRSLQPGAIARYQRHALIAIAVAALAAGAGVSVARVWQAMHGAASPQAARVQPMVTGIAQPQQQTGARDDADGNATASAASPRPLSTSDFDNTRASRAGAMAAVDPRALGRSTDTTRPAPGTPAAGRGPADDEAAAAASPIHATAHHVDAAATPPTARPDVAQTLTPASASTSGATERRRPLVMQPSPAPATIAADKTPGRPLRPLHRVTPRNKAVDEDASDPADVPTPPTRAPNAVKASDVQLF